MSIRRFGGAVVDTSSRIMGAANCSRLFGIDLHPSLSDPQLVVQTSGAPATGSSDTYATSPAVDTTGAQVLVVYATMSSNPTFTFTDSKGNTWVRGGTTSGWWLYNTYWYCISPTTGAGHTFTMTASATGAYPHFQVLAFAGVSDVAFQDAYVTGTDQGPTTYAPALMLPNQEKSLCISGIAFQNPRTLTIDSGMTKVASAAYNGLVVATAYKFASTSAPYNPTWTLSSGSQPTVGTNIIFSYSVPAATTYLVSEDWEGTGTPSGWTITGFDPDYTASPLVGSQSLRLDGSVAGVAEKAISGADDIHGYVQFNDTDGYKGYSLLYNGTTSLLSWWHENDGQVMYMDGVGTSANTFGSGERWASGQTYHIWYRYIKGTGSNGIVAIYLSTTSTKPVRPTMLKVDSTSTMQVDKIALNTQIGSHVRWDKLRIATTSIGSNPV